ncbi:MAG: hypothetical protein GEU68_07390 [Actinobacteria bacterium]|nr:hypothetical protein [Actinomycetota bacterium]
MRVPGPHAETADRVVSELGSDPQRGLDGAEARARLQSQGPNELRGAPQVPGWRKFLGQFADPLVVLLLAAVVVSLAVWTANVVTAPSTAPYMKSRTYSGERFFQVVRVRRSRCAPT